MCTPYRRMEEKMEAKQAPNCPKCGTVMCEQMREEVRNGLVLARPTGEFKCYRCSKQESEVQR